MVWLIRRLHMYIPLSLRLFGLAWLLIACLTLSALFSPPNDLINKAFGNEPSVLLVFTALAFIRGLIGVFNPKLYFQIFRAGLFITEHNEKRFAYLLICTTAFVMLSFLKDVSIPNWIIYWGIGAWLFFSIPYKSDSESEEYENWMWGVNWMRDSKPKDDWNPATGLPMAGGVDTRGNPYGCGTRW